jgi:hypothetical protein
MFTILDFTMLNLTIYKDPTPTLIYPGRMSGLLEKTLLRMFHLQHCRIVIWYWID